MCYDPSYSGTQPAWRQENERAVPDRRTGEPSLENLIETEDLGFEILHPGGLDTTGELARLCGVAEGATVLDVACGTGESACFLSDTLGARPVGLDAAESMIERARRKARARDLSVRLLRGDAHRLPFREGTFDAVISECTLSLLKKERVLKEMVRVARRGRCVGIHEISWKSTAPVKLRARLAELEGERPETLEGWRNLFEDCGLVEIKAFDRSELIPRWMKDSRKQLGLRGRIRISLKILRRWGFKGLLRTLQSERVFGSKHLGYALLVGRKE